ISSKTPFNMWGVFLAAQAVPTCGHMYSVPSALVECGHNVEVERIADSTGLFRAVEYAHSSRGSRQEPGQLGDGEGTVQTDLEQADLLAAPIHLLDGFLGGAYARSHQDDHAFCVGCTLVFD